jgi:hypothetical protein
MKYALALLLAWFWWESIIWIVEGKYLMDLFGFWWCNGIQCLNYVNWVVFCVESLCYFMFTQGLIPKHFSNFLCIKPPIHSHLIVFSVTLDAYYQTQNCTYVSSHVCDLLCAQFLSLHSYPLFLNSKLRIKKNSERIFFDRTFGHGCPFEQKPT